MTVVRTMAAIAVVGFSSAVPLSPQQEIDPNRLFVRVQTELQPKPAPTTAGQLPILRPGTLVTTVPDTPQSGAFVQVATDDGRKGFVLATAVRPLAVLEAEQQLEAFGGLEGLQSAKGLPSVLAAQCSPFPSCPTSGCATNAAHKLTNTRKRLFPKATSSKVLTFDELDLLQALTDAKGIPQGEHLTAAERKQLTNFQIGAQTISEGDHIAVTGFIAADRNIHCGGAESVNCGHSEPDDNEPACTRTDIHVPIVDRLEGRQVQSIVTEPIPQGENVKVWTPAAFREVKKEGRRVLIRGGLFYDSGHIVNTDEKSTTSQPKRFTLWELHPITAVLVCKRQDNKCDPETATDWNPLK